MSLVAYGSSDESSEDEGNNCDVDSLGRVVEEIAIKRTNDKLCLPNPKHDSVAKLNESNGKAVDTNDISEKIHFDKLPKPKTLITEAEDIEEDDILPKKEVELMSEKPVKKDRAPVKITVPSLSDFKDIEEENAKKQNRIRPSSKGTKLFALLPPPKGVEVKPTSNLIPTAVNKAAAKINQKKVQPAKDTLIKSSSTDKLAKVATAKSSIGISYDSNSEDEDDTVTDASTSSATDFFALTATASVSDAPISDISNSDLYLKDKLNNSNATVKDNSDAAIEETDVNNSQKILVSNVINLPKEEILLKNKAEVGPKLPIPEQEYNVDVEGNVAFDEKAIEYLCGRRGVKRKNKEIEEANIIEINGEDIKPDEREWLVKALTEEPIQRPVSMQSGGVSSQSKKKHQITYLAHQAKAMEMELKNQWAQSRMTRKQTQSKYGF
ncbi:proline-rich protein PRCC [Calliopsis andreniformis]|uniref:proline-rich protein PRCC n=1 Tax=Calliopsis andreniformis TaxID=337506 RepID=UPI003FCE0360